MKGHHSMKVGGPRWPRLRKASVRLVCLGGMNVLEGGNARPTAGWEMGELQVCQTDVTRQVGAAVASRCGEGNPFSVILMCWGQGCGSFLPTKKHGGVMTITKSWHRGLIDGGPAKVLTKSTIPQQKTQSCVSMEKVSAGRVGRCPSQASKLSSLYDEVLLSNTVRGISPAEPVRWNTKASRNTEAVTRERRWSSRAWLSNMRMVCIMLPSTLLQLTAEEKVRFASMSSPSSARSFTCRRHWCTESCPGCSADPHRFVRCRYPEYADCVEYCLEFCALYAQVGRHIGDRYCPAGERVCMEAPKWTEFFAGSRVRLRRRGCLEFCPCCYAGLFRLLRFFHANFPSQIGYFVEPWLMSVQVKYSTDAHKCPLEVGCLCSNHRSQAQSSHCVKPHGSLKERSLKPQVGPLPTRETHAYWISVQETDRVYCTALQEGYGCVIQPSCMPRGRFFWISGHYLRLTLHCSTNAIVTLHIELYSRGQNVQTEGVTLPRVLRWRVWVKVQGLHNGTSRGKRVCNTQAHLEDSFKLQSSLVQSAPPYLKSEMNRIYMLLSAVPTRTCKQRVTIRCSIATLSAGCRLQKSCCAMCECFFQAAPSHSEILGSLSSLPNPAVHLKVQRLPATVIEQGRSAGYNQVAQFFVSRPLTREDWPRVLFPHLSWNEWGSKCLGVCGFWQALLESESASLNVISQTCKRQGGSYLSHEVEFAYYPLNG